MPVSNPATPSAATPNIGGPTVIRIADPGELVAAIPILLGFHPRDSLVLLAMGGRSGRRMGLTVRIDLPPPEHTADAADAAIRGLLLDTPTGAAVIVVAGPEGTGPPAAKLVETVVDGLESRSVDVHTVIWTPGTAGGDRWACYDPCGCTGVVPDGSATPMAASAVAGGQVVFADRIELERLVAPSDPIRIRRREELLTRAADGVFDDPDDGPDDRVAGLAAVDAAIADTAAGRLELDDERAVVLAHALVSPPVRDAAMLRCAHPDPPTAAAAEQLWTLLTRELPDPESAEPAALLAVSALLRGDGALANVALNRAERAWPGHRLTGLLRAVAEAGVRPGEFRACLGPGLLADRPATPRRRSRWASRAGRRSG